MINDMELEKVNGGRNLWNLVTANFLKPDDGTIKENLFLDETDEENRYDLLTLEMKVRPKQDREELLRQIII